MISFLGSLLIRSLHATLRLRHVNVENLKESEPCIIAFWHCHLLLMLHTKYKLPAEVMISQSKDGELIAGVFKYYGVTAARGSSTRGGTAALRELIRHARAGTTIVFTPDGPKGPARELKDGVIYASQATGFAIVPIAFAAKKKSSCDRGTASSCRIRSRRRFSFTATRSSCRVTAMSKSGAYALNMR